MLNDDKRCAQETESSWTREPGNNKSLVTPVRSSVPSIRPLRPAAHPRDRARRLAAPVARNK